MQRANVALVAVLTMLLPVGSLHAAPTSPQEAKMVVTGWLRANPRPLETVLGEQVMRVEAVGGQKDQPVCYVVHLQPAGFVIVSGDDLVEPIIAFADDGAYNSSSANPLRALVTNDLKGRIAATRTTVRLPAITSSVAQTRTQQKWGLLRGLGEVSKDRFRLMALTSVPDVRVAPLVQSKWGQSWILTNQGSSSRACYNYYTPQILPGGALSWDGGGQYDGNPDNYPAGCVATATAQLMRYYEHPQESPVQPDAGDPNNAVGVGRFDSDGAFVPLVPDVYRSLLGGDGRGGKYVWAQMAFEPNSSTTSEQIKAIGALCHDAGVAARMKYTADESVTNLFNAKQALINDFLYENAVCATSGGTNIGPALAGMIHPNLDAGRPVVVAINGPDGGHAVVVDGYGYDSATLYHHLNMGWQGGDDVWYNLPIIECQEGGYVFTALSECLYNVFEAGRGEIISGRVLGDDGRPADRAVVHRLAGGSADPCEVLTDSRGIYFFDNLESETTYTVWASVQGSEFPAREVTTGTSQDYMSFSGNKWAVDFPQTYKILYVNLLALAGANDGSSWSNAFIDLRDALDQAASSPGQVTEIWVARGKYKPDRATGNRDLSFQLIDRVGLYGGFAGSESGREQRNPIANETILTGDLYGDDGNNFANNDENSYHVVNGSGTDGTAILDGFTIIAGNAEGDGSNMYGAGIFLVNGRPAISNCQITGNRATENGGGFYSQNGNPTLTGCTFNDNSGQFGAGMLNIDSSAFLSNCEFNANIATENGGGMYSQDSSPVLTDCVFRENSAQHGGGIFNQNSDNSALLSCEFIQNVAIDYGGGMHSQSSNPVLTNCTFDRNVADFGGGAFSGNYSGPVFANCSLIGNEARSYGGGLYNHNNSVAVLTNCIVWSNTNGQFADSDRGDSTVTYSDVEGGAAGQGNIDSEPFFADPDNGDYHLKSQAGRWDPKSQTWVTDDVTSPCIDAGDPSTPIGHEPFPNGGIVNMGAHGGTAEASKTPDN